MAAVGTEGGVLDPSLLEDKPPVQLQTPRREFFWDRLVWYAALSIFALAAVDAVSQVVQGSTLACNLHDVKTSAAADVSFITNYCYGELPPIKWLTVLNAVAAMFILAPHFLWLNLAYGKSIQFFTLANQLETVPSPKTGMWHMQNILLVKRMERIHSSSFILIGYIVKVIVQFLFAVAALLIVIFAFRDGNANFYCPQRFENSTIPNFWPLTYQVECTFATLKSLMYLRWVDVFLLIVIIVGLFSCLLNCTVLPHPNLVHPREVAEFMFRSSLDLKSYRPHLIWKCGSQMSSDMDFQVAELIRASEDLANTFQTVQAFLQERDEINPNEMARVTFLRKYAKDQPQKLLDVELRFPRTRTSYLTIRSPDILKVPTAYHEKYLARIRDPYSRTEDGSLLLEQDIRGAIFSFAAYSCKRDIGSVAVILKYGKLSMGIPCALARAFKKVILVNFNYDYKNPKTSVTKWEYPTAGITAVTFHPQVLWEKSKEMVETIRQIWGQASTPPQFQLSRTVEQTWAKAIPPQALPQKMGVKGVGGRETTTIKKVWEEQLPEKNPDPPPDPVFDSSALIMMKTLFPRAGAKIPARRTLAQRALAKRAMRALAQQTSTPLKSDFIVLCPMKNELDKSATTLFLAMLHSEGYLSEEARLLSTYPLKIAGTDATDNFCEYPERFPPDNVQQSERIGFQVHPCQHKVKNTNGDGSSTSVDVADGEDQPLVDVADSEDQPLLDDTDDEDRPPCTHDLTLKCGRVDCEFRFSLYKGILPLTATSTPE